MNRVPDEMGPVATAGGEDGFTLVEVLLALVVAGVVLAASFGWVWDLGALARVHDDHAQARTMSRTERCEQAAARNGTHLLAAPGAGHPTRPNAIRCVFVRLLSTKSVASGRVGRPGRRAPRAARATPRSPHPPEAS